MESQSQPQRCHHLYEVPLKILERIRCSVISTLMIVLPEPWHLPWPDGLPAEAAMASGSLAASRGHFCDSAVSFLFPGPHIFLFLDLLHCFGEECRLVLAWKRVLGGIFFTLQKFVCPPAYLISTWMFLRHFKDDTFKWRAWFLPSSQPKLCFPYLWSHPMCCSPEIQKQFWIILFHIPSASNLPSTVSKFGLTLSTATGLAQATVTFGLD